MEVDVRADHGAERVRVVADSQEEVEQRRREAVRAERLNRAERARREAEADQAELARKAKARRSSERTTCVRCGQPSQGGFCPACRDALTELRGLSDETDYVKPPLSLY